MRVFHVLVDVHEPNAADRLLRDLGHTVERRSLGALDYQVTDGDRLLVLAERKTHRDLVLSMIQRPRHGTDGARRLWTQMDHFEDLPGEAKVWLYERGQGSDPYPHQFAQAVGSLVSVQQRGHLLVPTRNLEESMQALVTVARRVAREAADTSAR